MRLADYTGDGKADVTVYNNINAAAYFGTGTGTGTFNFQSLFWSPGYDWVEPQDINAGGKMDVVPYNSTTGIEYSGISNGNGTFNRLLARQRRYCKCVRTRAGTEKHGKLHA